MTLWLWTFHYHRDECFQLCNDCHLVPRTWRMSTFSCILISQDDLCWRKLWDFKLRIADHDEVYEALKAEGTIWRKQSTSSLFASIRADVSRRVENEAARRMTEQRLIEKVRREERRKERREKWREERESIITLMINERAESSMTWSFFMRWTTRTWVTQLLDSLCDVAVSHVVSNYYNENL